MTPSRLVVTLTAMIVVLAGTAPALRSRPEAVAAYRFAAIVPMQGPVIRDGIIVVEDGRIKSIGPARSPVPQGVQIVDLRPLTAIPGLIDAHTHMTYYWDPASGTLPLKQPAREAAQTVQLSEANAKKTLETGVTTARDLGASRGTDYSMRDLIAAGKMTGPRMFVAGQGISAGRGAPLTAAAIQTAVESRVKAGSDWIKVYASRGSYQSVDTTQTISYEELKMIVDAAHQMGVPVAIHSYGASGVKDAVRAGADSVEHGIELDDETFAMMKRQGTVWVPTVDHNRYYVDAKDEFGFGADTIPPLKAYIEKNYDAMRRAHIAGVKMAMGSDAVYSMFGQNTRELAWFVKIGMTPTQALATATTIPAAMLKKEKELGALAPGYFADIVGVEGDPTKDIMAVINGVKWVMKEGKVMKDR